jgi:hypothetical protein
MKSDDLCQNCNKATTCTKLCEKAEEYVNQDHVPLRDLPVVDIEYGEIEWPESIKTVSLTWLERKVVRLLNCDLPNSEIPHILNITPNYFYVITHRINKKYNNS